MSRAVPRFRRFNAPLPPIGSSNGVVQYAIVGSIEGQLTVSTFFYEAPVNAPTQTQLQTLLGNLSTAFIAKWLPLMSADWTLTLQKLVVAHRNDLLGATTLVSAGSPGTGGSGHQPTEVAAIVNRTTAVKGQHGRGRLALPGVPLLAVTNSRITQTAYINASATLTTQMTATVSDGANTWTPVIAQRSGTSPRLVIGASPVISASLNLLLGTVRRRKIGRGK